MPRAGYAQFYHDGFPAVLEFLLAASATFAVFDRTWPLLLLSLLAASGDWLPYASISLIWRWDISSMADYLLRCVRSAVETGCCTGAW